MDTKSVTRRNFLCNASCMAFGSMLFPLAVAKAGETGEIYTEKMWDEFSDEEKKKIEASPMAKEIISLPDDTYS